VRNTTEHIWPVWNGYAENPNISEMTFGPLFIKPVGGEVNGDELGARDHVLAKHQLHHISPYSPSSEALDCFQALVPGIRQPNVSLHYSKVEKECVHSCAGDRNVCRIAVQREWLCITQ
jgi:hypothetical protein